jgi:hypothetical protein
MNTLYQDNVPPLEWIDKVGSVLVESCNNESNFADQCTYNCYCLIHRVWKLDVKYKSYRGAKKSGRWSGSHWVNKNKNTPNIGDTFGHLTIQDIKHCPTKSNPHIHKWLCICTCNNTTLKTSRDLHEDSHCGCRSVNRNKISKQLQRCYNNMHGRCSNVNHQDYRYYGGRGIKVCADWHDYFVFESWALVNGFEPGLTIDRRDNDLGYNPDNCRWVDRKTQARNRRSNHKVQLKDGSTMCLLEFAETYYTDELPISRIKSMLTKNNVTDPYLIDLIA